MMNFLTFWGRKELKEPFYPIHFHLFFPIKVKDLRPHPFWLITKFINISMYILTLIKSKINIWKIPKEGCL